MPLELVAGPQVLRAWTKKPPCLGQPANQRSHQVLGIVKDAGPAYSLYPCKLGRLLGLFNLGSIAVSVQVTNEPLLVALMLETCFMLSA